METSKAMSTLKVNETTLMKMKSVYQEEVAEYKVVYQLNNQDKEKARQERRLHLLKNGFPREGHYLEEKKDY